MSRTIEARIVEDTAVLRWTRTNGCADAQTGGEIYANVRVNARKFAGRYANWRADAYIWRVDARRACMLQNKLHFPRRRTVYSVAVLVRHTSLFGAGRERWLCV